MKKETKLAFGLFLLVILIRLPVTHTDDFISRFLLDFLDFFLIIIGCRLSASLIKSGLEK